MKILSPSDKKYWLQKEEEVVSHLVDLSKYDVVIAHECSRLGYTDDPNIFVRKAVADNLLRAKSKLPKGHNFKVMDGWRPHQIQMMAAKQVEKDIKKANPKWSEQQVKARLKVMAPPIRLVPVFASHRYGGAVDLTIVDKKGIELDMGVAVDFVQGPQAALLYYEFKKSLTAREKIARKNRRLLVQAMEFGGFDPYLPEYWHWSYVGDLF